MSNRDGPLTLEEAIERNLVCSDSDALEYSEIIKDIKSLEDMRKLGQDNLDEGRRDAKKDLSYTGTKIDSIGLHVVGPFAVGGRGALYRAVQEPIDYVLSENPRKRRKSLEKEFKRLGYENFAEKYKANLRNRVRAVKYLLEKQKSLGLSAKRFIREGDFLKKIKHPNVPHAIYADEYIIATRMFLDMVSLGSLRGRTSREELEIAVNLARVLSEINEKGFLHRDITPNNALALKPDKDRDSKLTPEERYQCNIIDFGQAKAKGISELDKENMSMEVITQEFSLEGTPAWMAPEVMENDLGVYSKRSEVYSLGATLYTLFTGRKPIDLSAEEKSESGNKVMKLIFKILEKSKGKSDWIITPVHEHNPTIPNFGLNDIIVKGCLRPNPKDRLSSVTDVYKALLSLRKDADSIKEDESSKFFVLPDYYDKTQVFTVNEKKDSTRVAKFDVEPANTLQKQIDLAKDEIDETSGATTLQNSIDKLKKLMGERIEFSDDDSIQNLVNSLSDEDDFFSDLNEAIQSGSPLETTKSLILSSSDRKIIEQANSRNASISLPKNFKPKNYNIPYTSRNLSPRKQVFKKFHKK